MLALSTITDIQDFLRIGKDYLAAIAWPAVAATFFLLFRAPIQRLIDRIQRGRAPGGFEFDSSGQLTPPSPPEGQEPLPNDAPPSPPAGTLDIDALRAYGFYWYYEKMFRLMYGSQLRLLQAVNSSPAGAHFTSLLAYHQEHLETVRALQPDYRTTGTSTLASSCPPGSYGGKERSTTLPI